MYSFCVTQKRRATPVRAPAIIILYIHTFPHIWGIFAPGVQKVDNRLSGKPDNTFYTLHSDKTNPGVYFGKNLFSVLKIVSVWTILPPNIFFNPIIPHSGVIFTGKYRLGTPF